MVASVALPPDNQNEDKHVESRLLPRLDEGSTPSSSTINTDNQYFILITPDFTPSNVRLGVLFLFILRHCMDQILPVFNSIFTNFIFSDSLFMRISI